MNIAPAHLIYQEPPTNQMQDPSAIMRYFVLLSQGVDPCEAGQRYHISEGHRKEIDACIERLTFTKSHLQRPTKRETTIQFLNHIGAARWRALVERMGSVKCLSSDYAAYEDPDTFVGPKRQILLICDRDVKLFEAFMRWMQWDSNSVHSYRSTKLSAAMTDSIARSILPPFKNVVDGVFVPQQLDLMIYCTKDQPPSYVNERVALTVSATNNDAKDSYQLVILWLAFHFSCKFAAAFIEQGK